MSEIKVTLESLYDILRNEKKKEDLQQLEGSFYVDVVSYMREKKALLERHDEDDEIFAGTEKDKLEYELRSIKRILKEIYEKREKKILDIALNKSRTKSDIIDTSSMLREEKEFYAKIIEIMNLYRTGVLLHLFKGELPFIHDELQKQKISTFKNLATPTKEEINPETEDSNSKSTFDKFEGVESTTSDVEMTDDSDQLDEENNFKSDETLETNQSNKSDNQEELDEQSFEDSEQDSKEDSKENEDNSSEDKAASFVKIKFLHPVPRFIWKDMKEYGPFEAGEETTIFPEVAALLERKGRAQKV